MAGGPISTNAGVQQPVVVGGPTNAGLPPPAPGAYTPTGPISTPIGPAMNPQGGAPVIPQSQLYQGIPANNNTLGGGGSPQISNLMQMLQGGGMQSMMQQLFSGKGPQTGMNPMNPMGANPPAQAPAAAPAPAQGQLGGGGKGPRPQAGGTAPVTPQ